MKHEATQTISYILLIAVAPFGNQDIYWWIGTAIVVMAAYSLRLMGDIRNKEFTWISAGIQLVTTVALCAFGYYLWKDAGAVRGFFLFFGSFQIYIFLVAFFSFFIVTAGDKVGKYGIESVLKNIVTNWISNIAAQKKEVPPNNNEEIK
jgi:hypothetical protein